MRRWIPALCFFLAAASANAQTIRLRGTVVSPDVVTQNAVVTIQGDRITGVAPAGNAQAVEVGGVIFPGLIDLHNHLTWNVMPNWHPPRLFTNRYEWQQTPEYATSLSGPYSTMTAAGAGCDMNLFGEVKALINGATSTVGGWGDKACTQRVVRMLDVASGLYDSSVAREPYRNVVFPFEPRTPADEQAIRDVAPTAGTDGVRAAVLHLAEGTDAAAAREYRQLAAHGFVKPGVSVIHAVALDAEQIRQLAAHGVGLVWSPHSNFILYGKTADVMTAHRAKMTIAVAPDWSPSGSAGMLEELQVAHRYILTNYPPFSTPDPITDALLVQMATSSPAKLAAIQPMVGTIEAGKLADLLVMKNTGTNAYQALLAGGAAGVRLVMIGGKPVYGEPGLMKQLLPGGRFEPITVCGEPKLLHIVDDPAATGSWSNVTARLIALMKGLAMAPAPIASC